MSGSGSFAVSRTHRGDRFYNPPAVRRQQQLLLQEQQEQRRRNPRQVKSEAENRTDSDGSDGSATTLSKPASVCSSSPPRPLPTNVTNLDRLTESVTPLVPAQYFSEANVRSRRSREPELHLYYCLGDLWESFGEWSVYGVGVPLVLNGEDTIMQYYVPFLSGVQLYVDQLKSPSRCRMPGEEGNAESSRETSSGGSSDCEADRRSSSSQQSNLNLRMNRLSLRDKSLISSSNDEAESGHAHGKLVFEYLEHEQPHNRKPLAEKISALASQFPEIKMYRSCDLLPASWISVAWYPIYRIPVGPTLKDLDASFLTFHSLSTNSKSNGQPQFHGAGGRKVLGGVDASSKISLPVFGLASYKFKGSILSPRAHECQQENSLLQAADKFFKSVLERTMVQAKSPRNPQLG